MLLFVRRPMIDMAISHAVSPIWSQPLALVVTNTTLRLAVLSKSFSNKFAPALWSQYLPAERD